MFVGGVDFGKFGVRGLPSQKLIISFSHFVNCIMVFFVNFLYFALFPLLFFLFVVVVVVIVLFFLICRFGFFEGCDCTPCAHLCTHPCSNTNTEIKSKNCFKKHGTKSERWHFGHLLDLSSLSFCRKNQDLWLIRGVSNRGSWHIPSTPCTRPMFYPVSSAYDSTNACHDQSKMTSQTV